MVKEGEIVYISILASTTRAIASQTRNLKLMRPTFLGPLNRARYRSKLGLDQTGHCGGLFSYRDICLYLWILSSFQSGTFNDLDHHQAATLASCFVPGDKSTEQIHLRTELAKPLQRLQESARCVI